ncbi:hypothetical protein DGWBC_0878 [Dehalogenimonas sp. WBC-2]|nr:hypothetical protein DGWBC_0878 [Dehalogenimonas sp. WBC-2]
METMTMKKRLLVIYLYLCGLSFDQIVAKAGVGKGSVGNRIAELKAGDYPQTADVTDQIEALRELAVNLNKLKLPAGQAAVGIAVLKRMYELGLDPSDMERWPLLLSAIKTQDDANELIQAAYAVRGIQKESGLSLPALENKVTQLGEKKQELNTLTVKVTEEGEKLGNLGTERKDLTLKVTALDDKFKWLVPRVQELEQREKLLLDRNKAMLIETEKAKETLATLKTETTKLEKTGLSVDALVDINKKLETVAKHHGIKGPEVLERLLGELKHLSKGLGIETLVKNRQQILKETDLAIVKSEHEKLSLQAVVGNLQQHKQNLEGYIQSTMAAVRLEIENLVPATRSTVQQVGADLKNGCAEALETVHHLKEESIKVGQDIGQYQAVLKESQWVKQLTALLYGGDGIDGSVVRTIALMVNRGLNAWFGQNETKSTAIGSLAMHAAKFLKEVEQWQPKA